MDACYQTLVEAINAGDLQVLRQLLQENPFILRDFSLLPPQEPLLCVATCAGKLDIVQELVRHRAELAKELNSHGLRPLDIASKNGNVEIVRELVKNDAEICRLKGKEKRTALHHAAIHGRVEVIDLLVSVCSEAIKDVTTKGETALHLAVKSGQLQAFCALLDWLLRLGEEAIINRGDCEENTVLHLAASIKQTKLNNLQTATVQATLAHQLDNQQTAIDQSIATLQATIDQATATHQLSNLPATTDQAAATHQLDNLLAATDQVTTTHQKSEGALVLSVRYLIPNNPQVATNQYPTEHQVIKLLLEIRNSGGVKVDVNAQNSRGLTAVNILNEIKNPTPPDVELRNELKSASAVKSKSPVEAPLGREVQNLLLVVAALFVTISFQGVINPPLYIFSTDSSVGNSSKSTSGNTTTTTPNTTSANTTTMTTSENTTTTMIPNGITRSVTTTTTTSGNTTTTTTSRNVTKTSVPSDHRSSVSFYLFFNTLVLTAALTTIELVTRRLVFRRELIVSSLCMSFLYGFLVAKLAEKESVPSYVLVFAIFVPGSMRLLPVEWAFRYWKWLTKRREERRWTQNNAG